MNSKHVEVETYFVPTCEFVGVEWTEGDIDHADGLDHCQSFAEDIHIENLLINNPSLINSLHCVCSHAWRDQCYPEK